MAYWTRENVENQSSMIERRYHKLYAEYKKVIQKRSIECLRGIVCIGCKRKCKAVFFLIYWNIFPKFRF